MSYVNLMKNDIWSESDIVAKGRAIIASKVPESRQNELRTILLGNIANMRAATPDELAEIALVQSLTEEVVITNAESRADMVLLKGVMDYEKSLTRLKSYKLSEGKPAVPAVPEVQAVPAHFDGNVWVDEVAFVPAVPAVPAIEPLPATVLAKDVNGIDSMVPNPAIVKDDAERAAAQQIVDNVSANVLALFNLRNPPNPV